MFIKPEQNKFAHLSRNGTSQKLATLTHLSSHETKAWVSVVRADQEKEHSLGRLGPNQSWKPKALRRKESCLYYQMVQHNLKAAKMSLNGKKKYRVLLEFCYRTERSFGFNE